MLEPTGHENVFVRNVRVGVIGNGSQVVNALHSLPVQSFNII